MADASPNGPNPDCAGCAGEGVDADPHGMFDYSMVGPCPVCWPDNASNPERLDGHDEHELYQDIQSAIRALVDEKLKNAHQDNEDNIRDRLTDEFRFWR